MPGDCSSRLKSARITVKKEKAAANVFCRFFFFSSQTVVFELKFKRFDGKQNQTNLESTVSLQSREIFGLFPAL